MADKTDELMDSLESYAEAELKDYKKFQKYDADLLNLGDTLLAKLQQPEHDPADARTAAFYVVRTHSVVEGGLELAQQTKYRNYDESEKLIERYREFCFKTLPICRLVGDKAGEALALYHIGRASINPFEQQQGIKSLEKATVLYQELGDKQGEARCYAVLSQLFTTNIPKSYEYTKKAVATFQEAGIKNKETAVLDELLRAQEMLRSTLGSPREKDKPASPPPIPSVENMPEPFANAIGQLQNMLGQLQARDAHRQKMNASEHSVAELVDLLNGKNANLREFAAHELGKSNDPQAANALIKALAAEKQDLIKWAIVQALGESRDPRAFEPLKQIVRGKANPLQSAVIYALAEIADPRVFELFIEIMQDKKADAELKSATAHALGTLGDKRAVEPLLALLQEKSADIKVGAIESLGLLGDARAYEPIVALLKHKNDEVRGTAVHALGNLGDQRAVEPLTALLNSDDYELREAAAETLDRLSGGSPGSDLDPDDVYDLHATMEESDEETHRALIQEFAGYEQPATPEAIQRLVYLLLISHDWQVENYFVDPTLKMLQESQEVALPILVDLLNSPVPSRSVVAASLLTQFEDARASNALLNVLENEQHPAIGRVIQVFAERQEPKAVPLLTKIMAAEGKPQKDLTQEFWGLHFYVARALLVQGAIDPIVKALQDPRKGLRSDALSALLENPVNDPRIVAEAERIKATDKTVMRDHVELRELAGNLLKTLKAKDRPI
jgi:HEAT repeat protein